MPKQGGNFQPLQIFSHEALGLETQAPRIDFGGSSGAIAVGEENIGGGNLTAAIAAYVNEALEPEVQALRIDFGGSNGAIAVGEENTGMELLDSDMDIILFFGASTALAAVDTGHNNMKSNAIFRGKALLAQFPREDHNDFSNSGLCALWQSHLRLRGSVSIF